MRSPLPLEIPSSRVRAVPAEGQLEEIELDAPSRPLARELSAPRWSRASVLSFVLHSLFLLIMGWTASSIQPSVPWGRGGTITATLVSSADDTDYFDDETNSSAGGAASQAVTISPASDAAESGADSPFPDEAPPVEAVGKLPAKMVGAVSDQTGNAQPSATDLSQGQGTGRGNGTGSGLDKVMEKGRGKTSVFGLAGEGYKFVYVFDRSGSMGGSGVSPLLAAKRELLGSLEHLSDTHQFQIIFYNEHPIVFPLAGTSSPLVFATEGNKKTAQRFVESIRADGGTAHLGALLTALDMAPDVIFFLTDADQPELTQAQMKKVENRNKGSVIHAIEFGIGPQVDKNNFLVRLARQNRGQHTYFDVTRLGKGNR